MCCAKKLGTATQREVKLTMAESSQERPTVEQTKLQLAEVLTKFPEISKNLKTWARKQHNCRITVTGIVGDNISAVPASLTGKEVTEGGSGMYWKQIIPWRANLNVYDCGGFPRVGTKQLKAKEIVTFQRQQGIHLLIFCIPITGDEDNFVHSEHAESLKRLSEEDESILSNTIIALIDTHQIGNIKARSTDQSQRTLKQFFDEKLARWTEKIRIVLERSIHLGKEEAEKIPIIPVSKFGPRIYLSEDGRPSSNTHYPWLSDLFIKAMPVTKPDGLPVLIKINQKRIQEQEDDFADQARALELIVEAQCLMFSKKGRESYGDSFGEEIGMIMGVNDQQDW